MTKRTISLLLGMLTLALVLAVPSTGQAPTADAAARKHVDTDYTLLRRAPASYVIGTAYRDWTVDVHGASSGGYRWSRVFGDLNFCLWIFDGAMSGSGAATDSCGASRTFSTSEFTNGQISNGQDDGSSVATVARSGCDTWDGTHITGFGNVQPWRSPAVPSAAIQGKVGLGQTVLWRYVTRDGKFVMIRDPRAGGTDGQGQQGWYFIPRGCLPASLPS